MRDLKGGVTDGGSWTIEIIPVVRRFDAFLLLRHPSSSPYLAIRLDFTAKVMHRTFDVWDPLSMFLGGNLVKTAGRQVAVSWLPNLT